MVGDVKGGFTTEEGDEVLGREAWAIDGTIRSCLKESIPKGIKGVSKERRCKYRDVTAGILISRLPVSDHAFRQVPAKRNVSLNDK